MLVLGFFFCLVVYLFVPLGCSGVFLAVVGFEFYCFGRSFWTETMEDETLWKALTEEGFILTCAMTRRFCPESSEACLWHYVPSPGGLVLPQLWFWERCWKKYDRWKENGGRKAPFTSFYLSCDLLKKSCGITTCLYIYIYIYMGFLWLKVSVIYWNFQEVFDFKNPRCSAERPSKGLEMKHGTDYQVPLLTDGPYNSLWWGPWCSAGFKNNLEMEKSIEVNNRLPDTTKSSTVIKVLPDCTENEKDLVTLSVREIHYEKVHMGLNDIQQWNHQ